MRPKSKQEYFNIYAFLSHSYSFLVFFLLLIFNELFASLFQYIENDDLPARLYSSQIKIFKTVSSSVCAEEEKDHGRLKPDYSSE